MTLHVNVEQRTLAATLKRLASVVESRNTIPILANVAIRTDGDNLTLTVTDRDIEATASFPATIIKPGETTIPAKMMADIVGKLPAGSLVALDATGVQAAVSAGKSKFNLATLSIEDFPALASDTFKASFTIPSPDLNRLMSTVFAASTEEDRYYLNGVYLHPRDGATLAVTTDGHRLAQVTHAAPNDFPGIIIPRKTVMEVMRSFTDGDVQVSVSDTKVRFVAPGFTLLSKVIDGEFPDYTRVIPKAHPNRVSFMAEEARLIVDRVITVSGEKIRAVKLSVSDGGITVENRSTLSSASDSMIAEMTGEPIDIGFNGAYLLDVLKQLTGAVTMQYGGPQDPVILKASDAAQYILMPYRMA